MSREGNLKDCIHPSHCCFVSCGSGMFVLEIFLSQTSVSYIRSALWSDALPVSNLHQPAGGAAMRINVIGWMQQLRFLLHLLTLQEFFCIIVRTSSTGIHWMSNPVTSVIYWNKNKLKLQCKVIYMLCCFQYEAMYSDSDVHPLTKITKNTIANYTQSLVL